MKQVNLTDKQKCFFIFMFIHLIIIILVSVAATINGYFILYEIDKEKSAFNPLKNAITSLASSFPILQYTTVAGISAGYGFFAPNVASEYELDFKFHSNKDTSKYHIVTYPKLRTIEGVNRYNSFLGTFQRNKQINKKDTINKIRSFHEKYDDALIKSVGRYLWKDEPPIYDKLIGRLYLFHHPTMEQSISKSDIKSPRLYLLHTIEIKK